MIIYKSKLKLLISESLRKQKIDPIDQILDKISKYSMESLSEFEQFILKYGEYGLSFEDYYESFFDLYLKQYIVYRDHDIEFNLGNKIYKYIPFVSGINHETVIEYHYNDETLYMPIYELKNLMREHFIIKKFLNYLFKKYKLNNIQIKQVKNISESPEKK